jgi:hypothetical protein
MWNSTVIFQLEHCAHLPLAPIGKVENVPTLSLRSCARLLLLRAALRRMYML